jgi:hypothetical protein
MNIYLNTTRNALRIGDEARRRAETLRTVKLFLAANASTPVSDEMIPDYLVNTSMIDRFFEIEPPQFRGTTEFDSIIEEIERSYVMGLFFSALSASVVSIERMLNTARIRLHEHSLPKLKNLWGKGATNEWQPNIEALAAWKYVSVDLANELSALYTIRCQYLHTGDISTVREDSLRAVKAAYWLLNELIGFPPRLFRLSNFGWECIDPDDAVAKTFYVLQDAGVNDEGRR